MLFKDLIKIYKVYYIHITEILERFPQLNFEDGILEGTDRCFLNEAAQNGDAIDGDVSIETVSADKSFCLNCIHVYCCKP